MSRPALRIAFHWVTVVLVAATFALGFLHDSLEDPEIQRFWLDTHRALGLTILVLTLARLLARVLAPVAGAEIANRTVLVVVRTNQALLYIGLLTMPLLGWAQSSAQMRRFRVFGVSLPRLVEHDPDLGELLELWHTRIGWLLLALVGLHSLAALYHHFVLRDHVLRSMLPGSYAPERSLVPPEADLS